MNAITQLNSSIIYNWGSGGVAVGEPGISRMNTYDNFNATKYTDTYANPNGGADVIESTYTFIYGTKKNPFIYSGEKWGLSSIPLSNRNDLIKGVIDDNSRVTTIEYTNTYNTQGYPIDIIQKSTTIGKGISSPNTFESQIHYSYIKAK